MSCHHSSATLQNSINAFAFPKSDRFGSSYKKPLVDSQYDLKDTHFIRATSIGYGNKIDFTSNLLKNSPAPNTYNLGSTLNLKAGITIKSKWQINTNEDEKRKMPGPSDYKVTSKRTTLPVTLKFRHGFYYEDDLKNKGYAISPQAYEPTLKFIGTNRFKSVKFGSEERCGVIGKGNINPGPGQYNLPGICDKYKKMY